jgi:hypothetical protein
MIRSDNRSSLVVVFLVLGSIGGCSSSSGHRPASAGGNGGDDTGGTSGSEMGGAGGRDSGAAGVGGHGPAADAAVLTADAVAPEPDTGEGPDLGGQMDSSQPQTMSDGSAGGDGGGGVAVCWTDPKVIMICHQLENACINCGSGKNPPANTDAVACFELIKKAYAGMATDADCVQFAKDHVCKPDDATTTGNVCGGLNCQAAGCKDPVKCEFVKQDGESDKCMPYVASCPCK